VLRVLSVFDLEAGEKIFQLCDALFGCGMVFPDGCQFHGTANLADSIEAVPPSVALHSMSQHLDDRKVCAGQCVTKRVDIFSPVGQKVGDDVFKVAVDAYRQSLG
jgi:hypothetical protein